ncbi:MAG: hypothetical protein PHE96_07250, partial [Methylococcales bacterium]|nr:hypothetical protein [Methylococcales bacterium]
MHQLIQTLVQYRLPVLLVLTLLVVIGCSASPSRGASKIVDFRQRDLAKISIEHTPSTAIASQPIQNNYALLLLENAIRLQLTDENRLQTDDSIHSLRLQLKILSYQDNVLLAQGKLYDDAEYLVYSQVKRRFTANEDWEEVMELVAEQMLDELMSNMRKLQQSAITEAPTRYFAYSSNYTNYNIYNNVRPRTYNTITYSSTPIYSDPYYNTWGWWRRHRDNHHRHEHEAYREGHQNKHHDEKNRDHHPENRPLRHWVNNGSINNPPLPGPGGRPRHGSKPDLSPAPITGLTPTPTTLPNNGAEAVVNPITEPSNGSVVIPINGGTTATIPTTGNGSETIVNPVLEPTTGQVVIPTNSGTSTTNPTAGSSAELPVNPSIDSNTGIATPPIGTSVDTNLTPTPGSNTEPATVPSLGSNSGSSAPTFSDPNIGIPTNLSTDTTVINPNIAPSTSGTSDNNGSSSTNTESGIDSSGSTTTTPSVSIESNSNGASSSVPDSSSSYSSGSSAGSSSKDSSPSYSSGSSSSSSSSDSSPSYSSDSSAGSSSMDSSPSYSSGSSPSSSSSDSNPSYSSDSSAGSSSMDSSPSYSSGSSSSSSSSSTPEPAPAP